MTGAFGKAALKYADHGLTVIPTQPDNCKVPALKGWRNLNPVACRALVKKFSDANLAFLDGPVTRVDIDDPGLIDLALGRFGETPIKSATPSGGVHLWYRGNGERRQVRVDGLAIDILGRGGFGVAPPSVNVEKGPYRFIEGGLDDIPTLPTIRPGALAQPLNPNRRPPRQWQDMGPDSGRNTELFKAALREVKESDNADHLLLRLQIRNEQFGVPLPPSEVAGVAKSAWRCEAEGRNRVGLEPYVINTKSKTDSYVGNPDAYLLRDKLRQAHGWKNGQTFTLANALGASLGWGRPRFLKAINFICAQGDMEIIQHGKRGSHQLRLARLKGDV